MVTSTPGTQPRVRANGGAICQKISGYGPNLHFILGCLTLLRMSKNYSLHASSPASLHEGVACLYKRLGTEAERGGSSPVDPVHSLRLGSIPDPIDLTNPLSQVYGCYCHVGPTEDSTCTREV